ncbi:DUF2142 domain-containing protein [Sphingobium sp. AP49]|uniref:DUF2142 domain-containing protein n=1 Tax=Sphingobium sp. AP49 TaxID=1144307 RepID=UPI00026EE6E8|nr:DUF2142 domain-containing protein [Sphingobium sp. AP49]WHO40754.1 DUF2142 domain-containing protein [Sphingobium sp. AP49]
MSRNYIENILFIATCLVTFFFAFITPPFQAPDENQHYMKALALSRGHIVTESHDVRIGTYLPRAALDLHAIDFPTEPDGKNHRYDRAMIDKAWTADSARPGTGFAEFPNVASYAPTLYAPGTAGILIGDALGLPHLGAFYIGRLVNALTALLLLAAALQLIPFGRMALLATALLPTFCYQAGSLSPDAVINGVGFLGLALALRVGSFGPERASSLTMLITGPLLALAKGVYLPLMAAGLRWPARNSLSRNALILGAMLLGAVIFAVWMKANGGSQALYHITSRKTGDSVLTAPLGQQLAVILADPATYARTLFSSIVERAPVYALQIVGRFGWNAILLPLLAYPLALLMLGSAVLGGSGDSFGIGQRLWWLAIAAGTALLIETAMYLTGTPLGADYVQGTQGRYFLPLLPLVLLALMPAQPLRGARLLCAGAGLLLLIIAMLSAWDSFWVHGFVTADGMPPHSSIARALLLPSPRW